jgi:hypothetical protein
MANLWPWIAVAGLGAAHGLSPASGWMFAAACGVRSGEAGQARRALLPIGVGQAASAAIVAAAAAQGMWIDRSLFQRLAGALLVGVACLRIGHGIVHGAAKRPAFGTEAAPAGIALWSFLMATAQGTGLMLVPVLVPWCLASSPARAITASGSLGLALAAVAVHTAAMLAVTGLLATGVCRGIASQPRRLAGAPARRAWTAVLFCSGVLLLAIARPS